MMHKIESFGEREVESKHKKLLHQLFFETTTTSGGVHVCGFPMRLKTLPVTTMSCVELQRTSVQCIE